MRYKRTRPGPIDYSRIRKIKGSFSQIEHRFINERFIDLMQTHEILLYFFLTAVADTKGVSFYSSERMAGILKITVTSIEAAREGLIQKGFIAYRDGVYQVLDLVSENTQGKEELQRWIRSYGQRLGGSV